MPNLYVVVAWHASACGGLVCVAQEIHWPSRATYLHIPCIYATGYSLSDKSHNLKETLNDRDRELNNHSQWRLLGKNQ